MPDATNEQFIVEARLFPYNKNLGIYRCPAAWGKDSPATRHNRGAVFSFADGHAEHWRWRALQVEQDWWAPAVSGGIDSKPDLRRLQAAVVERDWPAALSGAQLTLTGPGLSSD